MFLFRVCGQSAPSYHSYANCFPINDFDAHKLSDIQTEIEIYMQMGLEFSSASNIINDTNETVGLYSYIQSHLKRSVYCDYLIRVSRRHVAFLFFSVQNSFFFRYYFVYEFFNILKPLFAGLAFIHFVHAVVFCEMRWHTHVSHAEG